MVKLEKGGIYRASMVKSGETDRGRWQLVKVAEEKRKSGGAVFFVSNPIPLAEGGMFHIKNIEAVTWKAKKGQDGQWKDVTDVQIDIEPVDGAGTQATVDDVDTSGELPF